MRARVGLPRDGVVLSRGVVPADAANLISITADDSVPPDVAHPRPRAAVRKEDLP